MMISGPDPVTREVCEFVETFTLASTSPRAREQAAIHVADTVGVALAAATHLATRAALAVADPAGNGPVVWGQPKPAHLRDAAWVNGIAAHALDFDDTSMLTSAHLSTSVVPAVLTLGDHLDLSGAAVLEAYIVGHEVGEKIGHTLPAMESYARGWHGTAVHGVFGSAAGCARLLGLRGDRLAAMFGIAGSMASGLRRNTGTMTTALHAGNAARSGLVAALLAREGFTGSQNILDGPLSFWDVYRWQGEPGPSARLVPPGKPLGFEDPGVGIKPYPCGSPVFSVAEGMLAWKREPGFDAADVEWARAYLHPSAHEICTFDPPRDVMQAKYSVPYLIGAIAVFGALGIDEFGEEALAHPGIARIMPLVTGGVLEGAQWTSDVRYEVEPPTRLSLKLRGRPALEKVVDKVRGYPQGGLFTAEEAGEKFMGCARRALGEARAREALEALLGIEKARSVRAVTALLRG
jgi:2-methylcitrate dehydratase PrpD